MQLYKILERPVGGQIQDFPLAESYVKKKCLQRIPLPYPVLALKQPGETLEWKCGTSEVYHPGTVLMAGSLEEQSQRCPLRLRRGCSASYYGK